MGSAESQPDASGTGSSERALVGGAEWGVHAHWRWQGQRCHWRVLGDPAHPPLVLLHGFAAGSAHWRISINSCGRCWPRGIRWA